MKKMGLIILTSMLSITVYGQCNIEFHHNLYEKDYEETTASKITKAADKKSLSIDFNNRSPNYGIIRSNYELTDPKLDNFGSLYQEYSSRLELYKDGYFLGGTNNSIDFDTQILEMIYILERECH